MNAVDSEQEGGQSEDEEREDEGRRVEVKDEKEFKFSEDLPPCDTSAWKEFNLPLAIIKAIGDLRWGVIVLKFQKLRKDTNPRNSID